MKKHFLAFIIGAILMLCPAPARADLFGGDVAVLTQILAQAIMQLQQLRNIMGTATSQLDLIREINRGINDSLNLLKNIDPNMDPGVYRDWENVSFAIRRLEELYGGVQESPEAKIQKDTDQSVAEAVSFNNSFFKWSGQLDQVGEQIKSSSHSVSPGGAQKLTAQALGLIIQVLNQNLRAQATSLKLQAQSMAIENRRDKQATKDMLGNTNFLKAAMKSEKAAYAIPRF